MKNIDELIDRIKKDNISGSVDLAKKSAKVIIKLIENNYSIDTINKKAVSLVNAQPAMASIFNLVNNMFLILDDYRNGKPIKIIRNYCKKFLNELEKSDKKIGENALKLIKPNIRIITHSYSSTVLKTLLYAKKSGLDFSVICTESRPKNEGILFAKKLAKNKIKVNLVVDSAVFSLIKKSDLILVGCDAITCYGLVNKIGTMGIAITAKNHQIPIYTLCSSLKLLPNEIEINLEIENNPYEIIREILPNIKPINYYFDMTQLQLIKGFVTEAKILRPTEIKEKIKKLKVHKNLKNI